MVSGRPVFGPRPRCRSLAENVPSASPGVRPLRAATTTAEKKTARRLSVDARAQLTSRRLRRPSVRPTDRPHVRPPPHTRVSRPAAFVFVVYSYFLCRINKSKEHAQRHGPGGVIIKTTALFYIVLACWYCTHTHADNVRTQFSRSLFARFSRFRVHTPRTNKSVVEGLRRKPPSESKLRERAKLRGSCVHEPGKLSFPFFLITRHHGRYPLP